MAGTLQEIKVAEDETAEVGSVLAIIGTGAGPAKAEPKEAEPVAAAPAQDREAPVKEPAQAEQPAAEAPKAEAPQAEAPAAEAPKAAPASGCRSLRHRLRHPAGPQAGQPAQGGPVHRQGHRRGRTHPQAGRAGSSRIGSQAGGPRSVPRQAPPAQAAASAKRGTVEKAPRIRQVIARRMRESLDASTQLTQVHEIDMTKVVKLRERAKKSFQDQNGVKLTYLPFIAKAVAEALKQHPKLNAEYDEEKQEITYHNAEHLAIAVDTDKGLLVPVINDAGNLNLAGLAGKIADVADRTRSNKIGPDELSGGTFSSPTSAASGPCSIPRSSTSRRSVSSEPAASSSAPWWSRMRTATIRSRSAR